MCRIMNWEYWCSWQRRIVSIASRSFHAPSNYLAGEVSVLSANSGSSEKLVLCSLK
jgi:hypothetical protein